LMRRELLWYLDLCSLVHNSFCREIWCSNDPSEVIIDLRK
jgi:hypothetical protein